MLSFLRASWGITTWFLLLNVTVEGMEHRKAICEIISRPDTLASLGRVRSVLNEWFQLDGLVFAPAAVREVGDDFYIAAHWEIGRMDPLIAAQAIAVDAVCVTDNLRHFIRIPGLTIENWLRAA